MAYPDHLLVPGERVLAHRRPHWRMLVVPALVPPLAVGVAAWFAALGSGLSWRGPLWTALAVVAAGLIVWFSLAPVARWRTTHFVVTDRRLLVREGVVSRAGIAVAAGSITSVRAHGAGLDRALGAGTLVVAVDHAREPWEFDGLGDLARLASLVERTAEDAGGLAPAALDEADDDPEPLYTRRARR